MRMEQIQVSFDDDDDEFVWLSQENQDGSESLIKLSRDQVPLLIVWFQSLLTPKSERSQEN